MKYFNSHLKSLFPKCQYIPKNICIHHSPPLVHFFPWDALSFPKYLCPFRSKVNSFPRALGPMPFYPQGFLLSIFVFLLLSFVLSAPSSNFPLSIPDSFSSAYKQASSLSRLIKNTNQQGHPHSSTPPSRHRLFHSFLVELSESSGAQSPQSLLLSIQHRASWHLFLCLIRSVLTSWL